MAFTRKKGFFESSRILYIPIEDIVPNPNQPRKLFSPEGLRELADSIETHGILQPLSVRRRSDRRFELISGERRLRAAKLAHLTEVPCMLISVDDMESSLLALIENLQRRDLDFVEEAQALTRLIQTYHLSQEEAARKLGKSQSAVANKLRILRLPAPLLEALRQEGLSERHARALLRLPTEELQWQAVNAIVSEHLTVAKTDQLVEQLLSQPPQQEEKEKVTPRRQPSYIIKDVRLFLNSIDQSMNLLRRSGLPVTCGREEREDTIYLTISIPKGAR